MVELLSPAGDLEKLKIALLYGADAVYIGGKDYSLRANAKNFSIDDISKACKFAHKLGKKVYVTVNIVFHDKDLKDLSIYLEKLKRLAVDAIIASDIIVVSLAKKIGLDIILSTQASTLNYEAINFWQGLGVKRFVLGREASREDIIRIKKETKASLECFIHGAMCTSISGKCILSNYMTNRDSNRGGCAQICRWVFNTKDNPDFTFMSKDLCMVDYLEDMINIGIDSFKIEGRMRSVYYIATVISAYRHLIDDISKKTLTNNEKEYYHKVLDRVSNRENCPQFYNKFPGVNESYFSFRIEETNQDFLGIVLEYLKNKKLVKLEQRNYFQIGDEVLFMCPNGETFTYKINKIYDEDMQEIKVANVPKMVVYLLLDRQIEKFSMMSLSNKE